MSEAEGGLEAVGLAHWVVESGSYLTLPMSLEQRVVLNGKPEHVGCIKRELGLHPESDAQTPWKCVATSGETRSGCSNRKLPVTPEEVGAVPSPNGQATASRAQRRAGDQGQHFRGAVL